MRTVNIAELKARLSSHLQHVRAGEEVLVCDRNKPVARIIPCRTDARSEHERQLIASGGMTPPLKKKRRSWPKPPGNISDEVMARVWEEEREGR